MNEWPKWVKTETAWLWMAFPSPSVSSQWPRCYLKDIGHQSHEGGIGIMFKPHHLFSLGDICSWYTSEIRWNPRLDLIFLGLPFFSCSRFFNTRPAAARLMHLWFIDKEFSWFLSGIMAAMVDHRVHFSITYFFMSACSRYSDVMESWFSCWRLIWNVSVIPWLKC